MRDFIIRGYDKEEDGWVTGCLACDIITGRHRYGVVWNALQGCYKLLRLGTEYECTSFATKMKTIIGNLYELKDVTLKDKIYGTK